LPIKDVGNFVWQVKKGKGAMKEFIIYEITDPEGKEWETVKEMEAQKALIKGCMVFENKRVISHRGVTFSRLVTITQLSLDHFKERNF
jgi:hypothetical protein